MNSRSVHLLSPASVDSPGKGWGRIAESSRPWEEIVRKRVRSAAAAAGLSLTLFGTLAAYAGKDPDRGSAQRTPLRDFGVVKGLDHSSTQDIDAAAASANPLRLATLARGLHARVVTSGNAAPTLDMMAIWPVDHPTHLLACNEQGPAQPGVQRIDLATGVATTIVTGTQACDPLHVTPWGTVIFGEETSTGHVYELIDPLSVTNATLDRVTGVASTDKIVQRPALGAVAFEGIGILPNGVTFYGDELAPSSGAPGGAYYKFVPARPWPGGAPIGSLGCRRCGRRGCRPPARGTRTDAGGSGRSPHGRNHQPAWSTPACAGRRQVV